MFTVRSLLAGRILPAALCAVVLAWGFPVFGATIAYPDVSTGCVEFSSISESSATDIPPLFGARRASAIRRSASIAGWILRRWPVAPVALTLPTASCS